MVARFSSGEEGPFWAGPGWHCPPCSWLLVVVGDPRGPKLLLVVVGRDPRRVPKLLLVAVVGDPRGPKLPLVNVQLGSFSLLMGNV